MSKRGWGIEEVKREFGREDIHILNPTYKHRIIPILYLNVSTSNLGDFGLGTCCMHARMKIN
jgi:hypothetical protein